METPHLVGEEGRKVIVLVAGQDDKRVLKLGASVTTGPLSLLRLSFFNITAVLPRLRCPVLFLHSPYIQRFIHLS